MINLVKEGIILNKTELEFENEGVLNPAVIREGGNNRIFYRAVKTANYSSIGYCGPDGPLTFAESYDHPLIGSEFQYELIEEVNNVIFSSGTALFDDTLWRCLIKPLRTFA